MTIEVTAKRPPSRAYLGREAVAQITLVYPIFDLRGQGADRVRTWTHDQTLSRERYRVVVASGDANTSQEREVEQLLGSGDELVRVPGARDAALWNAGASRAGTPWLVFTEGHCLADPGCLDAVARWIAAVPDVAAGTFDVSHDESYLLGRMSRRWFDLIHARWREPGEWPRLTRSGFAIRADVFEAVGGFEPDYGQFAPALLSARLHARGSQIGAVPDAAVVHLDSEGMRDHHADTADYVRGELEARSRNDPVFFERYFGHAQTWANPLRHQRHVVRRMARAVVAAAVAQPKRTAELTGLLRRWRSRWSRASLRVWRLTALPWRSTSSRSSGSHYRPRGDGRGSSAPTPASST
jgi:hypothetical protein